MEWPLALDVLLSLSTSSTRIVDADAQVLDRAQVEEFRGRIGILAETVRDLAGRGVPVDQAVGVADWPWPADVVEEAVRRGYEQLPRSQKRLPLL